MKRIVAMYIVLAVSLIAAQSFGLLDDMAPPHEVGVLV
jgi:hypothetical protein